MSVSEQQKFKLLILQIRFLKEKLCLHEQIGEEAGALFSKSFNNTLKEMPSEIQDTFQDVEKQNKKQEQKNIDEQINQSKPNTEDIGQQTKKKEPAPRHLKKVYKDIAKVTHPDKIKTLDKLEKLEKENLFIKAKKALEDENFIDLMDVALHLKIPFPDPTESDVNLAKKKIENIRNKIKKLENTTAWKWYHSDDEEKQLIMKDYINYIYHTVGDKN